MVEILSDLTKGAIKAKKSLDPICLRPLGTLDQRKLPPWATGWLDTWSDKTAFPTEGMNRLKSRKYFKL
jgi:hypothetical protein